MSDPRQEGLANWAALFERLTPERIGEFADLCVPDVRFRDPFNDVRGIDALNRVFQDMFESCENPRFEILDIALGAQAGYLRWRFRFKLRRMRGQEWEIDGMSEIHLDAAGRVTAHLDHWDSGTQFYGRLPVLKRLIGLVRRRLSVER